MFAREMALHDMGGQRADARFQPHCQPCHLGHRLERHRYLHRLGRACPPTKRAVAPHEHCRHFVSVSAGNGMQHHHAGGAFITAGDLLGRHRRGERHLAGAQVGVSGAQDRDRAMSLRPGRGPRRVGVHHAPDPVEALVEDEMSGGVGGRPAPAFDHVALLVDHHHVRRGHRRIRQAGGLYHYQAAGRVSPRNVAPGEGDQPLRRQQEVGRQHGGFQVFEHGAAFRRISWPGV